MHQFALSERIVTYPLDGLGQHHLFQVVGVSTLFAIDKIVTDGRHGIGLAILRHDGLGDDECSRRFGVIRPAHLRRHRLIIAEEGECWRVVMKRLCRGSGQAQQEKQGKCHKTIDSHDSYLFCLTTCRQSSSLIYSYAR